MHQNVVFEQHYNVFAHFYNTHSTSPHFLYSDIVLKTRKPFESEHLFDEMTSAESAEIAPAFFFYRKWAPRFLAYLTTLLPCFTQRVVQQIWISCIATLDVKKNVLLRMRVWPRPNAHSHKCKLESARFVEVKRQVSLKTVVSSRRNTHVRALARTRLAPSAPEASRACSPRFRPTPPPPLGAPTTIPKAPYGQYFRFT